MAVVGVGLGANRGDRLRTLRRAVRGLRRVGVLAAVSSVWETPPFGETEQPAFLNQVVLLHTELSPLELLRRVKALERRLGRTPTYRWGPREIDLDLLFYDTLRLNTPQLTLPHPGLCEREFVLGPLREIAPEWAEALCPIAAGRPAKGAPTMFSGFDHFAIAAQDTASLAEWYCRSLGFEVAFRSEKTPPTFLIRLGNCSLEVMPANEELRVAHGFFDPGLRHIALSVTDFDAAYRHLQSIEAPDLEPEVPAAGLGRLANFRDPEGNQLQIVWRP